LANLSLRAATLGIRFLLLFFLAKYLTPDSLGYFGLFSAAVGYALYLVGLDFYVYANREIVKAPASQRGYMLKSQGFLTVCLYLALLPIGAYFLFLAQWPDYVKLLFFPILFLEHFNQEIFRLLIALSQQTVASVILFIRQAGWVAIIIALLITNEEFRNLGAVLAFWTFGGLVAAGVAIWKLTRISISGWALPVDFKWIKKGLVTSILFLISTLALRGLLTVDRYWIEELGGIEIVGVYVLLVGVASSLLSFLDAALFSFTFPVLIEHYEKGELNEIKEKVNRLLLSTVTFSALFALLSWLLLPIFLDWIDAEVYKKNISWYPPILLAMIFSAMSMVPHYGLYAIGQDKPIIYSHVLSLPIFITVTWLLSYALGDTAVVVALNCSFAFIFIWKSISYIRLAKLHLGSNLS